MDNNSLNNQKLWSLPTAGLLVLVLSACAPGLQVDPSAASGNTDLAASDVSALSGKASSSEGTLLWDELPAGKGGNGGTKELHFELKIPFGRVYKAASVMIDWMNPLACRYVTGLQREDTSKYEDGEIPCGRILDKDWKHLLTVNVPSYSGKNSGFDVKVSSTKVPVWLQRSARASTYTEESLDEKKTVTRKSSTRFAEDISFKYVPNGKKMSLETCVNLPGGTVTGTSANLTAKASKKIFGFKLSYSSGFEVTPGQATFDYGRSCVRASYDSDSSTIKMTTTKAPTLTNVKYSGLKIRIKDWFLRLADNIMRFFKSSIKDAAIKQITSKVNDLADKDIETGAWFGKIHGQRLLNEQSYKVSDLVSNSLQRMGVPTTDDEIKQLFKDNCRIKKFADKDWSQRLQRLCEDLIDKAEVRTELFAVDEASKAKGCYDYFARVHDATLKTPKWWAKECHFKTSFSLRLPSGYEDYLQELKSLLLSHISPDRLPEEWREHLKDLKVDPYILTLVLEKLEKEGVTHLVNNDWRDRIPESLDKLKARLAQ